MEKVQRLRQTLFNMLTQRMKGEPLCLIFDVMFPSKTTRRKRNSKRIRAPVCGAASEVSLPSIPDCLFLPQLSSSWN